MIGRGKYWSDLRGFAGRDTNQATTSSSHFGFAVATLRRTLSGHNVFFERNSPTECDLTSLVRHSPSKCPSRQSNCATGGANVDETLAPK
ncbi:unnamed protein product [Caenorhabditis auriculariae]|uniref:Uncharacterized protein n=1 Tax=Caenorhabditis auriculariae TaxID=2777116 RepID=A0A8S1HUZ6_9PELO|nr:unnamed protein product [Caenorhabditis auriculariae]